jgi:hypothetical protein
MHPIVHVLVQGWAQWARTIKDIKLPHTKCSSVEVIVKAIEWEERLVMLVEWSINEISITLFTGQANYEIGPVF